MPHSSNELIQKKFNIYDQVEDGFDLEIAEDAIVITTKDVIVALPL